MIRASATIAVCGRSESQCSLRVAGMSVKLANAIVHGNRSDRHKSVRICVGIDPSCNVLIVVKDAGSGFDPTQLPSPIITENVLAAHGRGIFLINRLMDEVNFNFDHGTAIYMRRRLSSR